MDNDQGFLPDFKGQMPFLPPNLWQQTGKGLKTHLELLTAFSAK